MYRYCKEIVSQGLAVLAMAGNWNHDPLTKQQCMYTGDKNNGLTHASRCQPKIIDLNVH